MIMPCILDWAAWSFHPNFLPIVVELMTLKLNYLLKPIAFEELIQLMAHWRIFVNKPLLIFFLAHHLLMVPVRIFTNKTLIFISLLIPYAEEDK